MVYADLELLTINTSMAGGRNSAGNLSPNCPLHCSCLYQSIKEGQARKNKTITRVEDGMNCRIDEKDTVATMVGRIER